MKSSHEVSSKHEHSDGAEQSSRMSAISTQNDKCKIMKYTIQAEHAVNFHFLQLRNNSLSASTISPGLVHTRSPLLAEHLNVNLSTSLQHILKANW